MDTINTALEANAVLDWLVANKDIPGLQVYNEGEKLQIGVPGRNGRLQVTNYRVDPSIAACFAASYDNVRGDLPPSAIATSVLAKIDDKLDSLSCTTKALGKMERGTRRNARTLAGEIRDLASIIQGGVNLARCATEATVNDIECSLIHTTTTVDPSLVGQRPPRIR